LTKRVAVADLMGPPIPPLLVFFLLSHPMRYVVTKSLIGAPSVKFNCPGCRVRLTSSLREAGDRDACPECGCAFDVPGVTERQQLERRENAEREKHAIEREQAAAAKLQAAQERAAKRAEELEVREQQRAEAVERLQARMRSQQAPASETPFAAYQSPAASPPPLRSPAAAACPYCGGDVPTRAQKCRHCGEWLVRTNHSDGLAGCLGFLLGPIGLWYKGHWAAGFAWITAAILFGLVLFPYGFLLFPIFLIGMTIHAAAAKGRR